MHIITIHISELNHWFLLAKFCHEYRIDIVVQIMRVIFICGFLTSYGKYDMKKNALYHAERHSKFGLSVIDQYRKVFIPNLQLLRMVANIKISNL